MKILLVEDDRDVSDLTAYALRRERFTVIETADGTRALKAVRNEHPDLVILDIGLPGSDGFEVLAAIKAQRANLPVIMLTGHQTEADVIRSFELQADDYVRKPFTTRELIVRILAIMRRSADDGTLSREGPLERGGLWLEPDTHEVAVNGVPVRFTPTEFRILYILMVNVPRVVTMSRLLAYVWADDGGDSNVLRTHITHIRRKLEAKRAAICIESLSGAGYRITIR